MRIATILFWVRSVTASERAGSHRVAGRVSQEVRTWLTNISWCWNRAPCP